MEIKNMAVILRLCFLKLQTVIGPSRAAAQEGLTDADENEAKDGVKCHQLGWD